MLSTKKISRKQFLQAGLAAGGGLLISLYVPGCFLQRFSPDSSEGILIPNAFLKIDPQGVVTILLHKAEMGQGVYTALPMIVAEELEADWTQVKVEMAPEDEAYRTSWGMQITGGSTSVRGSWKMLAEAGAAAREMLIQAAAKQWNVPVTECHAEKGAVHHPKTKQTAKFGDLVQAALKVPIPEKPTLKNPQNYKLLGQSVPRLDIPPKVNGTAEFGIDVKIPDQLIAKVLRCPVLGGKVKSFDATKAKQVPGVKQVIEIPRGIAVVAEHYWAAHKGLEALEVKWDEGANASLSSEAIRNQFIEGAKKSGAVAENKGSINEAFKKGTKVLEAVYETPFLSHSPMEPMNCTAYVQKDRCDVWVGTQNQTQARSTASKFSGLSQDKVFIHTTFLGGGFGRRGEQDFVEEAVCISKATGKPIKVVWSREDDTKQGLFRPGAYHVVKASLDEQGWPTGFSARVVAPSIFYRLAPIIMLNGIDSEAVEGIAELPYHIPNVHVDYVMENTPIPITFWRSVGSSQNAFTVEGFIDELAHAAGKDPYEFRRHLLQSAPRYKAVLEMAATKANWGGVFADNRSQGIAVFQSFGSYVAQVAEVSVDSDGKIQVLKVVCAIDCGKTVNPDTIKAQMESGIVYGLSAALSGEITCEEGQIQQGNFHDYPVLRMNEMPVVEVHILSSSADPGGVGEPAVPPIAPAVANAIFAATGKRLRRLPFMSEELKS